MQIFHPKHIGTRVQAERKNLSSQQRRQANLYFYEINQQVNNWLIAMVSPAKVNCAVVGTLGMAKHDLIFDSG